MKRKTYRMLILSLLICIISVAIMIVALLKGPRQIVLFTPPPFEATAVAGLPELTEEDGYKPIDANVYKFSICGELYLTESHTDIWLTNDKENSVWLKAVLKDEADNVLGETGLIRPGEYVRALNLTSVPTDSCDVKLIIMGYEPDTYYSMGNVSLYTRLRLPPGTPTEAATDAPGSTESTPSE